MSEPDFSKWTKDPRPTVELIRLALTEEDEHAAHEPVTVLQFRASREVLEAAERLCASLLAKERQLGAEILGQLGVPSRAFPNECFNCLAGTLTSESDPDVLQSIAIAFGFLEDPRCVEILLPFKSHADSDVRYGVVHGMSKQSDPRAIETLIELSTDGDEDVRDWATFGLGTLTSYDSPELRNALVARLNDDCTDARFEALVGLAHRKDDRALGPILDSLSAETVYEMALDAAEEFADPRLLPALLDLKERWAGDDDRFVSDLDRVIVACQQYH
jgi:HEAT repeat protein